MTTGECRRFDDVEELREIGAAIDYVVGVLLTKVYCLAHHDPKEGSCLILLSQSESPGRSFMLRDSAHGRD